MNDDELLTVVRDSFAGLRSRTPVEQIVSRARAVRARRRIPSLAVGLALLAAVVLAVATLIQASHHPTARLAAWTVVKKADGSIAVTIRELRDPAGLQRRLRADGVPASVRFFPSRGQQNPCQAYPGSQALQHTVVQDLHPGHLQKQTIFLVVHPAALPTGAGVGLQVTSGAGYAHGPGDHRLGVALVKASPRCTGS
jgi:hypothetical protein